MLPCWQENFKLSDNGCISVILCLFLPWAYEQPDCSISLPIRLPDLCFHSGSACWTVSQPTGHMSLSWFLIPDFLHQDHLSSRRFNLSLEWYFSSPLPLCFNLVWIVYLSFSFMHLCSVSSFCSLAKSSKWRGVCVPQVLSVGPW